MNMGMKLQCEPEVAGRAQSLGDRHSPDKGIVRAFRLDEGLVQR